MAALEPAARSTGLSARISFRAASQTAPERQVGQLELRGLLYAHLAGRAGGHHLDDCNRQHR